MKRTNIFWFILNSLFLIAFNLLFFMFINAEKRTDAVWVSYGFIHFSYLLMLLTPLLVRKGKAAYIYSRPVYSVTTSYFLIELAVGVSFILKLPDHFIVNVVTQVILALLFIAWLLSHLIANEHTAANVERREGELQYVKKTTAQIKSALSNIKDKSIYKEVEKAYDLIRTSPVKSSSEVYSIEQEIISEIETLECLANQGGTEHISAIANKIYQLARKRNDTLKLSNK